jgi:hypothetical protein
VSLSCVSYPRKVSRKLDDESLFGAVAPKLAREIGGFGGIDCQSLEVGHADGVL